MGFGSLAYHSENAYGLKERGSMLRYLVQFISGRYHAKPRFPILSPQNGTARLVPEVSPLALFPGLCLHSHRPLYIAPLALVQLANWL